MNLDGPWPMQVLLLVCFGGFYSRLRMFGIFSIIPRPAGELTPHVGPGM